MAQGRRWMPLVIHILPLLFIFTIMMGSMYIGWASPSKSAAARMSRDPRAGAGLSRNQRGRILLDALRATVDRHDDALFDHFGFDHLRANSRDLGRGRWRAQ